MCKSRNGPLSLLPRGRLRGLRGSARCHIPVVIVEVCQRVADVHAVTSLAVVAQPRDLRGGRVHDPNLPARLRRHGAARGREEVDVVLQGLIHGAARIVSVLLVVRGAALPSPGETAVKRVRATAEHGVGDLGGGRGEDDVDVGAARASDLRAHVRGRGGVVTHQARQDRAVGVVSAHHRGLAHVDAAGGEGGVGPVNHVLHPHVHADLRWHTRLAAPVVQAGRLVPVVPHLAVAHLGALALACGVVDADSVDEVPLEHGVLARDRHTVHSVRATAHEHVGHVGGCRCVDHVDVRAAEAGGGRANAARGSNVGYPR
mmetsp:Transcript_77136/g.221687  ORF Transcript_77136/g.221687 Transcript_77136/m.221687 type:complete len:316 (+) Transcript_77136:721-1668(+)